MLWPVLCAAFPHFPVTEGCPAEFLKPYADLMLWGTLVGYSECRRESYGRSLPQGLAAG